MNYLRKTLWGVGLIILVELLKKIFVRMFPEATAFHYNLLTSVQFVILLWTTISLLSLLITSGNSSRRNLLVLFLLLALPELLFTYWLHHPSSIPSFLVPTFQRYYIGIQRNHVQWNANCSAYNSSLFYTLKPSSRFVFANYEFSDSFYTNEMGLRDDDSSLVKPGIICLGDSYTMGWGVEQNETFAELLSRRSGKKVLNAGVSSYGTARELTNLYRLDTSNLQYIIIQYCRNDVEENRDFIAANYSLYVSPQSTYNSALNISRWMKTWYPGKHFTSISKMYAGEKLSGLLKGKTNGSGDTSLMQLHRAAVDFADILIHSAINFKKIKVYVVDLSEKEGMNNDFLDEVNPIIGSSSYKEHFNNNLIMVPVADLLGSNDYYILDDHLRASGHRKVSDRLNNYMFPGK